MIVLKERACEHENEYEPHFLWTSLKESVLEREQNLLRPLNPGKGSWKQKRNFSQSDFIIKLHNRHKYGISYEGLSRIRDLTTVWSWYSIDVQNNIIPSDWLQCQKPKNYLFSVNLLCFFTPIAMVINPVGLFPNQLQTGTSFELQVKWTTPVWNATKALLACDSPPFIDEKMSRKGMIFILWFSWSKKIKSSLMKEKKRFFPWWKGGTVSVRTRSGEKGKQIAKKG